MTFPPVDFAAIATGNCDIFTQAATRLGLLKEAESQRPKSDPAGLESAIYEMGMGGGL